MITVTWTDGRIEQMDRPRFFDALDVLTLAWYGKCVGEYSDGTNDFRTVEYRTVANHTVLATTSELVIHINV